MPKYVIEREIPDIGNVTPEQVIGHKLGSHSHWMQSITGL